MKMIEHFKDASDEEVFKQVCEMFCLNLMTLWRIKLKQVRRISDQIVVYVAIENDDEELKFHIAIPRYKVVRSK